MKKLPFLFVLIVVVLLVGVLLWQMIGADKSKINGSAVTTEVIKTNYRNLTFTLRDFPVTFVDGVSEISLPGSLGAKTTVSFFGNELSHDIDGDGDEDVVFLVTEESGGSGKFFYVVGAIKEETGYRGSRAMLLGDRIAPQTTEAGVGRQVVVNFAERAAGEPMTTSPSVGRSLYLLYNTDTNDFGEVVQDFEGEGSVIDAVPSSISNDAKLELAYRDLSDVPKEVFGRHNIEGLDLSHNSLNGSLPGEIRFLKELRLLDLSDNNFTGVPAEIGQLENLEVLDLSNNPITGLPNELGNLKNLKFLDLRGTQYSHQDLETIKRGLSVSVEILTD